MKQIDDKSKINILKPAKKRDHLVGNEVTHEMDIIENKNKPCWLKRNHEYLNTLTSLLLAVSTLILTVWGIQLSKTSNYIADRQNLPLCVAMGLDTSNPEIINQGGPIGGVDVIVTSYMRFHSYASFFESDNDFDYYVVTSHYVDRSHPSYNYSSNSFTYSYEEDDKYNEFLSALEKRIREVKFVPNLGRIRFVEYISIYYTDYKGVSREEFYINNGVYLETTSKLISNNVRATSSFGLSFADIEAIDMDDLISHIRDDYNNYERQGFLPNGR
jgi:hypothetical protein